MARTLVSSVPAAEIGKGLPLPSLTTAQRDAIASPAEGLTIYNSSTDTIDYYATGAWNQVVVDITLEVSAYSSSTVLADTDSVVLVNASVATVNITLPAPASGKVYNIKKTDSSANAVVISPPSGTIDGAASKSLAVQYDALTIVSDGANFFII
jgi:hypothetical protein